LKIRFSYQTSTSPIKNRQSAIANRQSPINQKQKIPPDIAAGEDIPKTDYVFMSTANRAPAKDLWNGALSQISNVAAKIQQSEKVARRGEATRGNRWLKGVRGIITCCEKAINGTKVGQMPCSPIPVKW
jgi:hypothetical protein